MKTRRLARAALLALALATAAAPAAASPNAEVGIEDERILLSGGPAAAAAVQRWAALGVDVVRLHAGWAAVAPGTTSPRRPEGFDPADPDDPGYEWAGLDRAVALARSAGLRVMLTVTGPGPLWTSRRPERGDPRYDPDPGAFAQFARAVATRYRAAVDRYLLWNEPNLSGWLRPQGRCRGACTPVAPHLYRALVRAALPAIKAADPGAQVLLGELAPIGRPPAGERASLKPLPFLRAMACVDARYRPIRGGACRRFRPARADAFGYHPHGRKHSPEQPNSDPDKAQIADLPRLLATLDRLARMRRLIAPASTRGRFDLYLTEFGYQTLPPDRAIGVTPAKQAQFLQEAAYLTWRVPRVRLLTQYQWQDEAVRDRGPGQLAYAGWQSGLFFLDGRPKPALAVWATPFVIDLSQGRRRARLWGQVRPGRQHRITILRRSGATWLPVARLQTNAAGEWTRVLKVGRRDDYRFHVARRDRHARRRLRHRAARSPGGRAIARRPTVRCIDAPGGSCGGSTAQGRVRYCPW